MEENVKRLGIFCFYDSKGEVDSCVEYLIKNLKTVVTYLIVVVNGEVNAVEKERLNRLADRMIIRKNVGYDFGAYFDVLTGYVEEELREYEELVLCNDTFFGPFISFQDIFNRMKEKQCDFWGLNLVEDSFLTHLQSFFLVFKKRILQEDILKQFAKLDFISQMLTTREITDIYAVFEVGLFRYLLEKGYLYDSYTNTKGVDVYKAPDICMKKYGLPIMKRKCFEELEVSPRALKRALHYVREQGSYNISFILESVKRKYDVEVEIKKISTKDSEMDIYTIERRLKKEDEILAFIKENVKIYIYGSGVYARKIWFVFRDKIEQFGGFVVSDEVALKRSELYNYPIRHYKDIEVGSAIIIGCDYDNTKEILEGIKQNDVICGIWQKG